MLIINEHYTRLENTLKNESVSTASSDYEEKIAENINILSSNSNGKFTYSATQTGGNVKLSDVYIKRSDKISAYLEVKMNSTDNLGGNPRVYYSDYEGGWCSSYETPSAPYCVNLLNKSTDVKEWVYNFKLWLCEELKVTDNEKLFEIVVNQRTDGNYIPSDLKIVIPTVRGGLKSKGAIPYEVMLKYVTEGGAEYRRNIYTSKEKISGDDFTNIVNNHYLTGKQEPTSYLQSGDNLYSFGGNDPFG